MRSLFLNFYFNTISNCLTGGIRQEFKAEQEHKVCVMRLVVPIIWDDTTHIVFNICYRSIHMVKPFKCAHCLSTHIKTLTSFSCHFYHQWFSLWLRIMSSVWCLLQLSAQNTPKIGKTITLMLLHIGMVNP